MHTGLEGEKAFDQKASGPLLQLYEAEAEADEKVAVVLLLAVGHKEACWVKDQVLEAAGRIALRGECSYHHMLCSWYYPHLILSNLILSMRWVEADLKRKWLGSTVP